MRVLRISLLLFLFIFCYSDTQAAPVDSVTAKIIATNFYSQYYSANNISLSLAYTEVDDNGLPVYYIFNVNGNNGFVIVCADDIVHPVIGYSNTGHYNPVTLPVNIAGWFNHYKKEVEYARSNKIAATSEIQNEWTRYKNNQAPIQRTMGNVNPLIGAVWEQAPYFNKYCPDTCVAGCVATAMAQIMKYWAFPPHGLDSASYDDPGYGTQSACFDTTHYNWAAMPNLVSHPNAQVAILSYQLGVSVNMAYTPELSGSYMLADDAYYMGGISSQTAYPKYFGYNGGTIQGLYMSDYTYNAWVSMLENELNNGRPIQYAGDGDQGGHSWVCDGYNSAGDFHMNWGWGGGLDGYYALSSLSPGGTPLNNDEEALIGIEPRAAVADFKADHIIIRAGDTVHFTDNSFGTAPITNWQWNLPGANIISSDSGNPTVVIYPTPGSYNATETVTNSKGNATKQLLNYITVLENDNVNVFPTTNDGNFTIQLHDGSLTGSNIQFNLYDVLGHKVYTTTLTHFVTQVSLQLPHGLYVYRTVNTSEKTLTWGKLIIGD